MHRSFDRMNPWLDPLIVFGAITSAAATLGAALFCLYPFVPMRPDRPISRTEAAPITTDFEITAGTLQPEMRRRYLLGLLEVATDYFSAVETTLENKSPQTKTGCYADLEFSAPPEHRADVLIPGSWTSWYRGGKSTSYFDLSPASASTHKFFSYPGPALDPARQIRMRIVCEQPALESSNWFEIGLPSP